MPRKGNMFKFKPLFLNIVAVLSVSMLLTDVAIAAAPQTRSCKQRRFCRPKRRFCCCKPARGEQGPQGEQGLPGEASPCSCVTTGCPNGLDLIVGIMDVSQQTFEPTPGPGFTYIVNDNPTVTITFDEPCQTNVERTVVATGQQANAPSEVSIVSQDAGTGIVEIRFSGGTEFVHFIAACCGVTPIP